MIELIKEKIASYIVKKNIRENIPIQQSFSQSFKNSFNFLVLMPENESDFRNAFIVIDFLDSNNKTLTVFTNDFRVALLPVKFRNKTLSFSINEISKLKLPSNELIAKLKKLHFDIVIDLNREENLFYSFVSNIVNAKIRIGMEKKKSNNYYNLIFSDNIFESNIFYTNLLNCLKMF
jgi:hypothetical protein